MDEGWPLISAIGSSTRSWQNNKLLEFPEGLEWLPNINREDFRNVGYIGARGRGQIHPTVQEMPSSATWPSCRPTLTTAAARSSA